MLTSGAASRTTPRSRTENIPCIDWARMPIHLLPPPRPERPAMPSAHARLTTPRPLPHARQRAARSRSVTLGPGNCPKPQFHAFAGPETPFVRKHDSCMPGRRADLSSENTKSTRRHQCARILSENAISRGHTARERHCPKPRNHRKAARRPSPRPSPGGRGCREARERGAAESPTAWGAAGSAGSRRNHGRSCGPASRPRHTWPATGTDGTCCRQGPRTAPA